MKTYGKVANIVAALAALAVSGTALASHKDGHSNGQGPKLSIDVENLCEVVYSNGVQDGIFLKVTTTVDDTSDDNNDTPAEATTKVIQGVQLVKSSTPPKKNSWIDVGPEEDSLNDVVYLNLCSENPLSNKAKALNASIQVAVGERYFMSRCGNPFLVGDDLDGDPTTDEVDQSRIDLDEFDPPLSCSN